jgi:hypothetical protein
MLEEGPSPLELTWVALVIILIYFAIGRICFVDKVKKPLKIVEKVQVPYMSKEKHQISVEDEEFVVNTSGFDIIKGVRDIEGGMRLPMPYKSFKMALEHAKNDLNCDMIVKSPCGLYWLFVGNPIPFGQGELTVYQKTR